MRPKVLKGHILPLTTALTMSGLIIALSFLKYSSSASRTLEFRIASEKAYLAAQSGLNHEVIPYLPFYTSDTTLIHEEYTYKDGSHEIGSYKAVGMGSYFDMRGREVYRGYATGISKLRSFTGEMISVERQAYADFRGKPFSYYMYFTHAEEPGGGPGLGAYVSFGDKDTLEGAVHTNGNMTMSNYGCPKFYNETSKVTVGGTIAFNNCNPDSIFDGTWEDSVLVLDYPPEVSLASIKNNANYTFTADNFIGRGPSVKDTLIMTKLVFEDGGFVVSQWPYLIPPVVSSGPEPIEYLWSTDTLASTVDNGKLGIEHSFQLPGGYVTSDTLIMSMEDMHAVNVADEITGYSINDTMIIASMAPDSFKTMMVKVVSIPSLISGNYVIKMNIVSQFFPNNRGFAADEPVLLSYKAPPDDSFPHNSFAKYHSHGPSDICRTAGLHHYDFPPEQLSHETPKQPVWITPPTKYNVTMEVVIYVKRGQVLVEGEIDGQYTVITDEFTEYRRHDDPFKWDRVYNNIWFVDDLVFNDSNPINGAVPQPDPLTGAQGTTNRMGLISGANVIIANTAANGWRNRAEGVDVKINAAIMAVNESFSCHYWQNSTTDYHDPEYGNPAASLADGRGHLVTGLPSTTGVADMRGTVYFWGSLVQLKRGYMRRNLPGPYPIAPGIGYYKNYHFDFNLWISSPPRYPTTEKSNGGRDLLMVGYGEL